MLHLELEFSNLVRAVITAESCFKRKALSSAGAQGLMQLIPATAKRFGVRNSYDPKQNIRGGIKYLKFLLARYKGNLKKTIAAYNAGEGKVDHYKGIPPYKETRRYVKNVLKIYDLLKPRKSRVKATAVPQFVIRKRASFEARFFYALEGLVLISVAGFFAQIN